MSRAICRCIGHLFIISRLLSDILSVVLKRAFAFSFIFLILGLFHQVIQQSGSPLAHWSVARHQTKPNFFYKSFVTSSKCYRNTSLEIKRCIQKLDSDTLESIVTDEFEVSCIYT